MFVEACGQACCSVHFCQPPRRNRRLPPPPAAARLASPQVLFKDLFVAVQSEALYEDGKTFVDAVPNTAPDEILKQYHNARPRSPAALRQFVADHFDLPAQAASVPSPPEKVSITTHIDQLWDQLTRKTPVAPRYSSALPLPYRYVVPGGRFREIYYWDSYFTMLGLAESGRQDLLTDMVRDFAFLLDTYGHIPNGARTYYLSRSQPPFFFAMVGLLSKEDPAAAYARYLPQLKREYAFWMEGGTTALRPGAAHRHVVKLTDGSILNRYWDDKDTPRDESYREDVEVATQQRSPRAGGISRPARRRRKRLGLRLALVRRRQQPHHHRHHRNRTGRSQQPVIWTRECDPRRLRA